MKNGIDIQITQDNQVFMKNIKAGEEVNRRVTEKGSVIRYLKNEDREILFSNGNTSYYHHSQSTWTSTNNKGLRRQKSSSGCLTELDQIQALRRTDPAGNKILIRDDQVVVIHYTNGDRFVQHHDGTQMMTKQDSIVVTNPDYLTVRLNEGSLRIIVSENNHFLLLSDKLFLFLEDGVLLVDKANEAQRILVNSAFLHYYE